MSSSIFLDFHLPDSPSWFYFSFFLAIALFYQFGRPLTLRNWDLIALFLFAPGLLLILEANRNEAAQQAVKGLVGGTGPFRPAERTRFVGYSWLLGASAFWFVRCLIDFAAIKRPLLTVNLATPGLIWFGASLFICFTAVAYTRPVDPWESQGRRTAILPGAEDSSSSPENGPKPTLPRTQKPASFWVDRSFATISHLAVVIGLFLIGAIRFQNSAIGVSAATLYLLIPYAAFQIGQVNHVWPAAVIVWAIYLARFPCIAGLLIGLATGTSICTAFLLPAWFQYYRKVGAYRLVIGAAVGTLLGLGISQIMELLALNASSAASLANVTGWHPWRLPSEESIWTGVHWAYRLPVFIIYLGFVLTTIIWPPIRNLGNLVTISAALLIGIQFWYANHGGLFVLWYAPLLVLVVLRPNITEMDTINPWQTPRIVKWIFRRTDVPKPDGVLSSEVELSR